MYAKSPWNSLLRSVPPAVIGLYLKFIGSDASTLRTQGIGITLVICSCHLKYHGVNF